MSDADLKFAVSSAPGVFTPVTWGASLSANTWYRVDAWHDATADTIYITVNAGTPVTSSHANGAQDGATAFALGCDNTGGNNFDGRIEEVLFSKRIPTSDEWTALYNSGNACRPTGL
jgi:hypothetical protein